VGYVRNSYLLNDILIPVAEVALRLGKRKAHVFKVIDRLKIPKVLEKRSDARGQKVAHVSEADFERLKEHLSSGGLDSNVIVDATNSGVFYLMQLEPEHDPGRFKLGFATNIEERFRSHKTAAPLARLVDTWPCKLLWEKIAIDSISQDCERLYTEIFRSDSVESVKEKCDQFFSLMPKLSDSADD